MKFVSCLLAFLIWLAPVSGHAAEIIWSHTYGYRSWWSMDNLKRTSSGNLSPSPISASWEIVGSGDFNSDGKADLLWRSKDGYLIVWFMDGKSRVTSSYLSIKQVETSWKIAGVGDFNSDGKPDILWRHDQGYVAVWHMDGVTFKSFSYLSIKQVETSWKIAGVGDFNSDGKPDLLWRHDQGYVVIWFMNGVTRSSGGYVDPSWVDPAWKISTVAELFPLSRVTFGSTSQKVRFQVINGQVQGMVSAVKWSDVESVSFNSDRVGWTNNSSATVAVGSSYEVTIPNTADNDVGGWSVKLKSTGNHVWFNVDDWKFSSKTWSKTSAGLIQYGDYQPPEVDFSIPGKMIIRWNANRIYGFIIPEYYSDYPVLDPDVIESVHWNSDKVGWPGAGAKGGIIVSDAGGLLQIDQSGHYFSELTNLPIEGDHGSITVNLGGGMEFWIDLGVGWNFTDNVDIDETAGVIYYSAP